MKQWIVIVLLLVPALAFAAGGNVRLQAANNNLTDQTSLQRGAQLFTNYCAGCHSTQYQRYERVAIDLGIPVELMQQHLMFNPNAKIGDLMTNAMSKQYAAASFGVPTPDLTMVARVRGTDWLYTYLHSFYADPSRPFGVNNTLFPSVGMPHVLEELQGVPRKIYETQIIDGSPIQVLIGIETDGSGELNSQQYDTAVRDLVNFLDYSAEPMKLERQRLGLWVMGFIVIFLVLTVLLKKEYWRDVH
ncbi:cytochrome c1 [Photobacterium carnosum]|uniref:cytochrome c1 n=1 Tax=Photobacterium carnosum TaxID=2023717 RepID=UPI001C923C6C|nr:cytochrome c1 [Photobacterium carnosum]MBY3788473.1 cytochrome c1 [Photobacterium carnosum]MCD9533639.1 cytochrome c1 [Photobacterium carnosum]